MKREFLQNIRVGDQSLPKEVIDAIMEENGRDIQGGKVWKEKYELAVAEHEKQLKSVQLESLLQQAITKAGGRNAKAIRALLDPEALQADETCVTEAVAKLKEECEYLFESKQVAAPFAPGTGTHQGALAAPETLAGALKERFAGK